MTTEAQFRADLVREALRHVGADYRDSSVRGNWPPQQFDCSVFQHWICAKWGLDIDRNRGGLSLPWPPAEPDPWHKYPGYTLDQQRAAKAANAVVSFDKIKPGDRLYYDKPGAHHVVMYIGNGQVCHAAGTAYGVIVSPVVGPGEVGHGGKTLSLCVSVTKHARALGLAFTSEIPKPPAGTPKPRPSKDAPVVHLGNIQPGKKSREVELVQHALAKTVGLDYSSGPGTFGPKTRDAYAKWQRKCGFSGNGADGKPGSASLKKLGAVTGLFRVIT